MFYLSPELFCKKGKTNKHSPGVPAFDLAFAFFAFFLLLFLTYPPFIRSSASGLDSGAIAPDGRLRLGGTRMCHQADPESCSLAEVSIECRAHFLWFRFFCAYKRNELVASALELKKKIKLIKLQKHS